MIVEYKSSPKVTVAVVGRFHAFELAEQLQNRDMLQILLTTYPKILTRKWNIESEKVKSEIGLEILRRYGSKIPLSNLIIDRFIHKRHALHAKKFVKSTDVFIGWSGSSLEALIECKEQNKISILERGSSHCSFWRKILCDEYSMFDIHFDMNYKVWERELLEYELADYISIPSNFVKRTFIENGVSEKKLIVNPYGVNLASFQQLNKEDDIFRVIYVGGLTYQKGSHYLLQAFNELDLPGSEFWHVGSISNEFKPLLKNYANNKIKFLGHKPQDELFKYYSQGSVFAIASIQDGFGMVVCQAMACGLPVICTTNTGGADLIGTDEQAGFVVPVRDVEALKSRLLYLYENQEVCRTMGQVAKQRITTGLTWVEYGNRYAENIRRISQSKTKIDKNKGTALSSND